MASPISYILNTYTDKVSWFVKAYEPATNIIKNIYFDAQELSGTEKVTINSEGFTVNPVSGIPSILYIDGYFDLYLFEDETEADNNDFTNAIKIADNVTADKDSASLNIPDATDEIYGNVRLATQAEAEATTPVDENLAMSPKKLDVIATDNMQSKKATNQEVLDESDLKWMTSEDYDTLVGKYNPPITPKDYIIGQTFFKHKDIGDADNRFLRQDGATFDSSVYPDLSMLPDYRQGDLSIIGVTQGSKNITFDTEGLVDSNIKFLKIGVSRWFGVVRYQDKNYFFETSNLKTLTVYTDEELNIGHDLTKCSLAYDSNENVVSILNGKLDTSGIGNFSIYVSSAYITGTGLSFVDHYRRWESYSGLPGFQISKGNILNFGYNNTLQKFVCIFQYKIAGEFRLYMLKSLDFTSSTEDRFYSSVGDGDFVFSDEEYITINEKDDTRYKNGKYYLIGENSVSNSRNIEVFSIDENIPSLNSVDVLNIPTLTDVVNYNKHVINDDGKFAMVIGFDSATGRFEMVTSDDLTTFTTSIVDTGFTSMTSDCYVVPVKNYWLLKTGDNYNTAYTKDFVTIDLETTYTGLGSQENMFVSFIETTNTFIEYTSAGTDGNIYTLENDAEVNFSYKTIKMMGEAPSGSKEIIGWSNPQKEFLLDSGRSLGAIKFIKISDTLSYGMIEEGLTDSGIYNVVKSTDGNQTFEVLTQAQTGVFNSATNRIALSWDGGDYICITTGFVYVSIFKISTESFSVLNYNLTSSPVASGNNSVNHYNETLNKFVLINTREDSNIVYISEFENDDIANKTVTAVSSTANLASYAIQNTSENTASYKNGKYYIYDRLTYELYSISESDWTITIEHTFVPSLTSKSTSTNFNPVQFNKDGKMAFIISYDNTNEEIEVAHSDDMITYSQSVLSLNNISTISDTGLAILPIFDSWVIKGVGFDTIITKDFTTAVYVKSDWSNEGGSAYIFNNWDDVNNKLIQYTSGSSSTAGNPIYTQTIDATIESTPADPNYVDRSYRNTYPYVYGGEPQS